MSQQFPRCQIVPLPDQRVSFQIDGQERLQWHFGSGAAGPFFYPLLGPSGNPLTRMGHPGAPNHDHHRSIWFAHHAVLGIDFWGLSAQAFVRQKQWLAYRDADDEALMAVELAWHDGHDPQPLLDQELVVAVRPAEPGETLLEVQATFRPRAQMLEFGQTNFGFFAVRVAKHISEHFGGGRLTGSEGETTEANLFGKRARWMDYSGMAPFRPTGDPASTVAVAEGITYFDHPANVGYPSHWHVREDGWMGASVCMHGPQATTRQRPLVLRYLLHAHAGKADAARSDRISGEFGRSPGFVVEKSTVKHNQYAVARGNVG